MTDDPKSVPAVNKSLSFKQSILDNLYYVQGRVPQIATPIDWYMSLSLAVRDRMMNNWIDTFSIIRHRKIKAVAYLSAEYLMGPQLGNNLLNLGLRQEAEDALSELGLDLEKLIQIEPE